MHKTQSPPTSPLKVSDSIELADFEEISVTPDAHHRHVSRQDSDYAPEQEDSDEEDLEGERALLGAGVKQPAPARRRGVWVQVKSIVIETVPTLLVTTIGLLFTGELLNTVSHWKAMSRVDELIMIIPVILNLKGNLEMNLSARLGTAANLGDLDNADSRRQLILGNLTLLQVQAAVVSFVAACVSFLLGRFMPQGSSVPTPSEGTNSTIPGNNTTLERELGYLFARSLLEMRKPRPSTPIGGNKISKPAEFIMVASTAMCTTALSSVVLGSFMCFLIVMCRRFGLDPDNIAPPVAGCLGDLVTLSILGLVATLHVSIVNTIIPLILVILLSLAAIGWVVVARRNTYVKDLLIQGWSPLFAAMIISSGTGLVLDTFVSRYTGFALIAVVITGLPGSVGSIFVSRLSTALHSAGTYRLPSLVDHAPHPKPRLVLMTLLVVSLPIQIVFLSVVYMFGWLHLSIVFAALEVMFFCITVLISLFLAQSATNILWSYNLDPDMYAMPLHSALMDLVGQSLLVACYELASLLGSKVRSRPAT